MTASAIGKLTQSSGLGRVLERSGWDGHRGQEEHSERKTQGSDCRHWGPTVGAGLEKGELRANLAAQTQ